MHKTTLSLLSRRTTRSALLKVRCSEELKGRVARAALSRESDLSTVVRDACRFYLAHHEQASVGNGHG